MWQSMRELPKKREEQTSPTFAKERKRGELLFGFHFLESQSTFLDHRSTNKVLIKMLEESTGNFSASRTAYDWFQDTSHVNLNIMVKNLTEDDVKVRLIDDVLDVTCSLADGKDFNLHFNLFRPIQVNESSWTVTPSKLEIKLKKTDRKRWQSLEVIPEKNSKRPASSAFPVLIQSPSKRITIQGM